MRKRIAVLRTRVERLLLWRVWERMLEIEFVDRSVALAGKAFVSFFPLVIVVAAFVPERIRSSIITSLTSRLGIREGFSGKHERVSPNAESGRDAGDDRGTDAFGHEGGDDEDRKSVV